MNELGKKVSAVCKKEIKNLSAFIVWKKRTKQVCKALTRSMNYTKKSSLNRTLYRCLSCACCMNTSQRKKEDRDIKWEFWNFAFSPERPIIAIPPFLIYRHSYFKLAADFSGGRRGLKGRTGSSQQVSLSSRCIRKSIKIRSDKRTYLPSSEGGL